MAEEAAAAETARVMAEETAAAETARVMAEEAAAEEAMRVMAEDETKASEAVMAVQAAARGAQARAATIAMLEAARAAKAKAAQEAAVAALSQAEAAAEAQEMGEAVVAVQAAARGAQARAVTRAVLQAARAAEAAERQAAADWAAAAAEAKAAQEAAVAALAKAEAAAQAQEMGEAVVAVQAAARGAQARAATIAMLEAARAAKVKAAQEAAAAVAALSQAEAAAEAQEMGEAVVAVQAAARGAQARAVTIVMLQAARTAEAAERQAAGKRAAEAAARAAQVAAFQAQDEAEEQGGAAVAVQAVVRGRQARVETGARLAAASAAATAEAEGHAATAQMDHEADAMGPVQSNFPPAVFPDIQAGTDELTEWPAVHRMPNGTLEQIEFATGAPAAERHSVSDNLGYDVLASNGGRGGDEESEGFLAREEPSVSTHEGCRHVTISSESPIRIPAATEGPRGGTDAPADGPAEAPAPALAAAPVPAPEAAPALPGSRGLSGRTPVNANIVSSLKIIVVGDSGVGKSALVRRFVEDVFDQTFGPTIGLDVTSRSVDLGEAAGSVKLDLWDSAGQERFAPLLRSYYRGAGGVIYVFDVTSRRSLDRIEEYWTGQVESNRADEATALLVGSKVDEQERRVVCQSDARALAERHGMPYIEVSSRTGAGVSDAFHLLAMAMLNSQLEADPRNPKSKGTAAPGTRTAGIDINFTPPPKKSKCC
eukprot:scaffold2380_cov102-Isochrysis_galbana.AAC.2